MPNKRHPDKRKLSVWMTKNELDALDKVAARFNISKTDVTRKCIADLVKKPKQAQGEFLEGK
tara:strand:+ start:168 stop:353 length:186 start_codon:yes stop_codon:yes gene_type:complete